MYFSWHTSSCDPRSFGPSPVSLYYAPLASTLLRRSRYVGVQPRHFLVLTLNQVAMSVLKIHTTALEREIEASKARVSSMDDSILSELTAALAAQNVLTGQPGDFWQAIKVLMDTQALWNMQRRSPSLEVRSMQ